MTLSTNPLRQFFRQPSIYIKLPSDGNFWPDGSLEMPQNREIPVFPMNAVDEITYRTPDALFNGQAVVDVIQSCVPCIKNAWHTPAHDLNSLLIAIRIASYGHEMEIESQCPHCESVSARHLDMREALNRIGLPDYQATLKKTDVEILFGPMTFENQNSSNIDQFEQQQKIRSITESDLSEKDKVQKMGETLRQITLLTMKALCYSIVGIRTPNGFVTDKQHILEYLQECDRSMYTDVREHVINLRQQNEIQPMSIECDDCHKTYKQLINLEMSNFFGSAS
jgi:hypothetical protein